MTLDNEANLDCKWKIWGQGQILGVGGSGVPSAQLPFLDRYRHILWNKFCWVDLYFV